MKIYIVILNWNGKQDTESCIDSLLASSIAISNIIVVDNGSTDGSVAFFSDKFPELILIQVSENLGFTGGTNIGIQAALKQGADAVLLLNNDTEVLPGFLEPLLKALQGNTVGIAGAKIYFYDDPGQVWFGNPVFCRTTARTYDREYKNRDSGNKEPMEVPYVSGCAMAIKRTVIDNVGYLDERFFCYAEELDYCMRAQNAGYKVVLVPESKIYHKVSLSTGGRTSGYTMYYRVRNYLLFAEKNLALNSRLANSLRSLFIIIWHCAALVKSDMKKLQALRYLFLGVSDYYKGRFGKNAEISADECIRDEQTNPRDGTL